MNVLRAQVADLQGKDTRSGHVKVSAIEEYQEVKVRYDTLALRWRTLRAAGTS